MTIARSLAQQHEGEEEDQDGGALDDDPGAHQLVAVAAVELAAPEHGDDADAEHGEGGAEPEDDEDAEGGVHGGRFFIPDPLQALPLRTDHRLDQAMPPFGQGL